MNIDRITKFNDWWTTGNVKSSLLKPFKRHIFFKLLKYNQDRQILLIAGLRRTGKTTILYQIIQYLIDQGVQPFKILYFSFDEQISELEDLLETYKNFVLKTDFDKIDRIYIFLDEIQKLQDWQNKLKIYYDIYPNIKFFISGSASVNLLKKSKESLSGRVYDFVLKPLSFKEFLELKKLEFEPDTDRIEIYKSKIEPLFHDYLRKNGFPEIIEETDNEKIKNYINNSVIERIIYKDLPLEFGIKDYELLEFLIRIVAETPGMLVNYDNISKNLKRNKRTIINYFSYLEYAMLVRFVYNYRKGFSVSSRKLKKAYLTSSGLSFVYVDNFYNEDFLQKIIEGLVINELDGKNYYRDKYEIDLIIKRNNNIIPIEVKYGDPEIKQLLKFLKEFDFKKGIIVTKNIYKRENIDNREILFIPIWAFLLFSDEYIANLS